MTSWPQLLNWSKGSEPWQEENQAQRKLSEDWGIPVPPSPIWGLWQPASPQGPEQEGVGQAGSRDTALDLNVLSRLH